MILLSDLDKTLIFSHNCMSSDNYCVEYKGDKPLSYMTQAGALKFKKISDHIKIIPVTARSREQYDRIKFPYEVKPDMAVICNGADILINSKIDPHWHDISARIAAECDNEFSKSRQLLESISDRYFDIRIVDGAFLFTKCHNSKQIQQLLMNTVHNLETDVLTNGDKLYVIPKKINKGLAVDRIRQMYHDEVIIAAGDSLFDVSMLNKADLAIICGNEIPNHLITNKNTIYGSDFDFVVDTICDKLHI